MTPTEKKYSLAIGELLHYNWQYWLDWDNELVKAGIVTVMVAGITKNEHNGRYLYNMMVMEETKVHWIKPEFKIPCTDLQRYTKPLIP